MRLTIVVDDNNVIIDGKPYKIDCSALEGIHAVQWNGLLGEIEYKQTDIIKPNERIDSIEQFQPIIDAWMAADAYKPPPSSMLSDFDFGSSIADLFGSPPGAF